MNRPFRLRSHSDVLATAAVLLMGVAASACLSEVAIRLLGLDSFRLELVIWDAFGPTAQYDYRLGWANLPGSLGTNRQGFRFPRDYQSRKNKELRIAIVGDSQVFGLWVDESEHLGVLVDAQSEAVEAYSFGVPGYGPAQEFLLLEDVLEDYAVDRVVVVAFLENDLIDATLVMAYGHLQKPYFERTPEGWRVANTPVPLPLPMESGVRLEHLFFSRTPQGWFMRPIQGLYNLSAVYRTMVGRSITRPWLAQAASWTGLVEISSMTPTNRRLWSIRRADGLRVPCWGVSVCPESHWLDGLEPAVAAYVEMARICRERSIQFSALVAPTMTELRRARFPITDRFTESLRERGVPLISLKESFLEADDPSEVISPDDHWTPLGTRRAAEAIVKHVWREGPTG